MINVWPVGGLVHVCVTGDISAYLNSACSLMNLMTFNTISASLDIASALSLLKWCYINVQLQLLLHV